MPYALCNSCNPFPAFPVPPHHYHLPNTCNAAPFEVHPTVRKLVSFRAEQLTLAIVVKVLVQCGSGCMEVALVLCLGAAVQVRRVGAAWARNIPSHWHSMC